MNLQEMLSNLGKSREYSEEEKNEQKEISAVLVESKYNILLHYLNDSRIYTTGDLKKLSDDELASLKMRIPNISGVGEERINLFINKIDEIRNTRYFGDEDSSLMVNYGNIGDIDKCHIEINHLKCEKNEFIDIRKVGIDKNKVESISLKFEEARELLLILKQYFDEENKVYNSSLLNKIFSNNNEQSRITSEMIVACYKYGKEVINNNLLFETAVNILNSEFLMNKSSARMYISCLRNMVNGLLYTRNIKMEAVEYYLKNIKNDFGNEVFELAISSVKKNIQWNRKYKPDVLKGLEDMIGKIEHNYN